MRKRVTHDVFIDDLRYVVADELYSRELWEDDMDALPESVERPDEPVNLNSKKAVMDALKEELYDYGFYFFRRIRERISDRHLERGEEIARDLFPELDYS